MVGPGLLENENFANWSDDDLEYTVSWSKISCWSPMYFAHIFFCYIIVIAAFGCFITRMHSKLMPYHAWFGRVYIMSMYWTTATSLLVHNTGLPVGVLISFLWVLGGMTVAWILICIHRDCMEKAATKRVSERLAAGDPSVKGRPLDELIAEAKGQIAAEKTILQRIFSLKASHGALMFMSFMNIFGRIFASDQSGGFTCHTVPYFKGAYTASGLPEPVPVVAPNYEKTPWGAMGLLGWGLALSIGPLAAAWIFGSVWACVAAKISATKAGKPTKVHEDSPASPTMLKEAARNAEQHEETKKQRAGHGGESKYQASYS
jgi:hypothetical protein